MNVSFDIPDDIAAELQSVPAGEPMQRRALESFALEEYRHGRITKPKLRRMLGIGRYQLDGFLKEHGLADEYTVEDLERDRKALDRFFSRAETSLNLQPKATS